MVKDGINGFCMALADSVPGVSGGTIAFIMGFYDKFIGGIHDLAFGNMKECHRVLSLDFSYIPCLTFFGCGILAGAVTVVKAIKACLEKFRAQTVYLILGMMIGSLYAIGMGPTTLEIPQAPLGAGNFPLVPAVIGAGLVFGMQKIKEKGAEGQKE